MFHQVLSIRQLDQFWDQFYLCNVCRLSFIHDNSCSHFNDLQLRIKKCQNTSHINQRQCPKEQGQAYSDDTSTLPPFCIVEIRTAMGTDQTNSDKQKIIVTWLETNDTKTSDTPVISVSSEDFWNIFEPLLKLSVNGSFN